MGENDGLNESDRDERNRSGGGAGKVKLERGWSWLNKSAVNRCRSDDPPQAALVGMS